MQVKAPCCSTLIDREEVTDHYLRCTNKTAYWNSSSNFPVALHNCINILLDKIQNLEMQNSALVECIKNNIQPEDSYSITERFDIGQFEIDGRYKLFTTKGMC